MSVRYPTYGEIYQSYSDLGESIKGGLNSIGEYRDVQARRAEEQKRYEAEQAIKAAELKRQEEVMAMARSRETREQAAADLKLQQDKSDSEVYRGLLPDLGINIPSTRTETAYDTGWGTAKEFGSGGAGAGGKSSLDMMSVQPGDTGLLGSGQSAQYTQDYGRPYFGLPGITGMDSVGTGTLGTPPSRPEDSSPDSFADMLSAYKLDTGGLETGRLPIGQPLLSEYEGMRQFDVANEPSSSSLKSLYDKGFTAKEKRLEMEAKAKQQEAKDAKALEWRTEDKKTAAERFEKTYDMSEKQLNLSERTASRADETAERSKTTFDQQNQKFNFEMENKKTQEGLAPLKNTLKVWNTGKQNPYDPEQMIYPLRKEGLYKTFDAAINHARASGVPEDKIMGMLAGVEDIPVTPKDNRKTDWMGNQVGLPPEPETKYLTDRFVKDRTPELNKPIEPVVKPLQPEKPYSEKPVDSPDTELLTLTQQIFNEAKARVSQMNPDVLKDRNAMMELAKASEAAAGVQMLQSKLRRNAGSQVAPAQPTPAYTPSSPTASPVPLASDIPTTTADLDIVLKEAEKIYNELRANNPSAVAQDPEGVMQLAVDYARKNFRRPQRELAGRRF